MMVDIFVGVMFTPSIVGNLLRDSFSLYIINIFYLVIC